MENQSQHSAHSSSKGTLPIVIGVTGHRDLRPDDIPKLKTVFRGIISEFMKKYPSTPLVLLSSLAEGADRLAAEVGIELGIEVVVPLPFQIDEYKKDFLTETSCSEFDTLIAQTKSRFVIPFAEGVTAENINLKYSRDSQYGQVGGYISHNSQVLIAFWDGVHLDLQGGTSSVVRMKLEGNDELEDVSRNPLDPPDSGPVYHIVTPRNSQPETKDEPFSVKILYPNGSDDTEAAFRSHQRIFEQIELFNSDAVLLDSELETSRTKSKQYVFPAEHYDSLSQSLRATIDNFAIADTLASRFQLHTTHAFQGLFLLVFTAAAFFDFYAHLFYDYNWVLVGYFLTFIAAFFWYERAKRGKFQSKYLDYRALAEGLRVQLYWQYCGIRYSTSEFYMRKQKSELDWIRFALRTFTIPRSGESSEHEEHHSESKMQRLEVTQKAWVEDQAKYYKKSLHRDHHKLHKMERNINWIFFIGVALTGIQLFLSHPNHYLIVAIGLAPIIAALIGSYLEKNGLVGHIKQYERMNLLFHQANAEISYHLSAGNRKEAVNYILELGKEALSENGDWLLHHRERPLEVPKG